MTAHEALASQGKKIFADHFKWIEGAMSEFFNHLVLFYTKIVIDSCDTNIPNPELKRPLPC